jgi:hypothetical protein
MGTPGSDQPVNAQGIPTPNGEYIRIASGAVVFAGSGRTAQERLNIANGLTLNPRTGAWDRGDTWQTPAQAAALEQQFGTAESNQANRDALAGVTATHTPPPTPGPRLTLPASFAPPTTPLADARYLVGGNLINGAGTVLNANRTADDVTPIHAAASSATDTGGAQQLPTNNTTALASSVDWKRLTPYLILAALVVLFFVLHSSRRGATA